MSNTKNDSKKRIFGFATANIVIFFGIITMSDRKNAVRLQKMCYICRKLTRHGSKMVIFRS